MGNRELKDGPYWLLNYTRTGAAMRSAFERADYEDGVLSVDDAQRLLREAPTIVAELASAASGQGAPAAVEYSTPRRRRVEPTPTIEQRVADLFTNLQSLVTTAVYLERDVLLARYELARHQRAVAHLLAAHYPEEEREAIRRLIGLTE